MNSQVGHFVYKIILYHYIIFIFIVVHALTLIMQMLILSNLICNMQSKKRLISDP